MQIKTCSAASLPELMKMVALAHGPDAVLLSVRRIEATETVPCMIEGTVGLRGEIEARVEPQPAPKAEPPVTPPPRPHPFAEKSRTARAGVNRIAALRGADPEFQANRIVQGAVLVGPMGSGKTTAAAKIAGKAAGMSGQAAGMISTDTQRPGGAALMLACAEAQDFFATSVDSASKLRNRVTQWNGRGPLVIDTRGFAPRDEKSTTELKAFLDALDDTLPRLLVLSATDDIAVSRECLKLYDDLKLDGVIVTRTDLDLSDGACVAEVRKQNRPLAFVGTGENLTGGLDEPAPKRLTVAAALGL